MSQAKRLLHELYLKHIGQDEENLQAAREHIRATGSHLTPEYVAYLRSPAWQEIRQYRLIDADFRCQNCGARDAEASLQVHHRHYDTLFCEDPSDLEVLARSATRKPTTIGA